MPSGCEYLMIQHLHIMMNIRVEHPGTFDDLLNSKLLQVSLALYLHGP